MRKPRSGAATCSGAVTSSPLSWLTAAVRALTAERRAARSIRIASTGPSADFGHAAASPDSTARAAASASAGSDLVPSASPPLGAKHLDHRHIVCGEMTRQARAVAAGAFHTNALHAAQAAQPSPQLLMPARVAKNVAVPSSRPVESTAAAVCVSRWVSTPPTTARYSSGIIGLSFREHFQWIGLHRPERRTVHSRRLNRRSYQVTFLPTG